MKEQVWWYATRAAGLMTWSAAVASVLVGLMLSTRRIRSRIGPWVLDIHRFLGGLTLAFLLIHLVTLWADSYVAFGWEELLVPGRSQWRPQAVAWGVVSAWILFAVEMTSILRTHIGPTLWRSVHWMSVLVVGGGTVHAVQAGSDVGNPMIWAVAGAGSAAFILLGAIRLLGSPQPAPARRPNTETAILLEMRQRLADMPVPETSTRLEYVAEATASPLPRRETEDRDAALPGGGALIGALDRAARRAGRRPAPAPVRAAEALPLVDPLLDTSAWTDLFDDPHAAPRPPGARPDPETVPTAAVSELPVRRAGESSFAPAADPRMPVEPTEPQPFLASARTPASPFTPVPSLPPPPPPPAPPPPPPPPAVPTEPAPPEPPTFEPAVPEFRPATPTYEAVAPTSESAHPAAYVPAPTPTADQRSTHVGPFSEIEPPTVSLTAPPPPARATVALAPPPLPEDAVDPVTGEPDEAAYRQWLVEWLRFAEHYGDETPTDPTRF